MTFVKETETLISYGLPRLFGDSTHFIFTQNDNQSWSLELLSKSSRCRQITLLKQSSRNLSFHKWLYQNYLILTCRTLWWRPYSLWTIDILLPKTERVVIWWVFSLYCSEHSWQKRGKHCSDRLSNVTPCRLHIGSPPKSRNHSSFKSNSMFLAPVWKTPWWEYTAK